MKLLIVDDSAMIRRAISSAYKGSVFTDIQTASDGLLAVTIFKQFLPDVVTLDITMPHMDGLAALSQMLKIKPNVHILVISALADHHTAIESLTRGAEQFICKPFTPEELREALDDLTQKSEAFAQHKSTKTHDEQINTSDVLDRLTRLQPAKAERAHEAPAQPSPANYPSGYVQPPTIRTTQQVKPQVSWGNYSSKTMPNH